MKYIEASEIAADFDRLLSAAESGHTIVILRDGRPVARLVPDDERRAEIVQAIADIQKLRRTVRPASVDEILEWRDAGRK